MSEEVKEKQGFFKRLVSGLTKTRDNIVSGIDAVFHGFSHIDDEFYEELEEILIMGDIGVKATMAILDDLRRKVKEQHIKEPMDCKNLLIESIKEQMRVEDTAYEFENRKSVVMAIGVNGVGKTTSVGKLAGQLKNNGKKVIMAAADTFRAAAIEQLTEWSNRAGVDIIAQSEDRRNIIGFCNWYEPEMTMDMCEKMATAMDQAHLSSEDYYLFSATSFEPALKAYVIRDPRFKLINMNEL